jgi:hypothetical protein
VAFFIATGLAMHLLYLDESGNSSDSDWFVLAGVSVPERQTHWIEQDLNEIAKRFEPDEPFALELHGNPMRTGKGRWRRVPPKEREQAILDALGAGVANRRKYGVRVFAAAIDRRALDSGQYAVDVAFEQLAFRFDHMLGRLNKRPNKEAERGLILLDKSSHELSLQSVTRDFKYNGHSWGKTRNLAEVPVFLDSTQSRMIQLADLVAYAVYQRCTRNVDDYFDLLKDCFDHDGSRQHGWFELNMRHGH